MKVPRLLQPLLEKIKPYLKEKQPEMTTQRCCVYYTSNSLQLVHVNKKDHAIELLLTQEFKLDDLNQLPLVLSSFVKKNGLNKVPAYWLLSPEHYQLLLLDGLPIPENEIRAALNWRIRGLLSYPVNEAALDYFLIPPKKAAPEHPMIGCVSAKKAALLKTMDILEKCGLPLRIIDIPEMALKNLSDLYENDEKCTAFIYFSQNSVILNISCDKTLYFSRHFILGKSIFDTDQFATISLELRRYFDYFQSQWRLPTPTRIFVATEKDEDNATIVKQLSDSLLTNVSKFSLAPLLDDENARNLLERKFLLAFGSALREGYQYVPARD